MEKKIWNLLSSTRLMAALFLIYATALGIGTFIETYYDTTTARIWVYNAWWFELIMALFVVNFIGNIGRYNLLKKENWAVLLLHLSWIFIIIGAGITRYISDEGRMSIREGQESDFYTSEHTYITTLVDGTYQGESLRRVQQSKVMFAQETNNTYAWESDFKGEKFSVRLKEFIKGAEMGFVADPQGETYLKIVEGGNAGRHEHYIKDGEVANIHGVLFSLNKLTFGAINLQIEGEKAYITTPFAGTYMNMLSQNLQEVKADMPQELFFRSLYNLGQVQFVLPEPLTKGRMQVTKITDKARLQNAEDALVMEISSQGQTKEITVFGRQDIINQPVSTSVGNLDFHISYGSIRKPLPFKIYLDDFIADKYPGTEMSYSAFKSKIKVINPQKPNDTAENFDYEIYMNNILNHKGYRFFQASFHPDEQGTILSVSNDFWGTLITYIGYTLLYIGLIATMFFGKTRFISLSRKLKEINEKRKSTITILAVLFSVGSFAQKHTIMPSKTEVDSIITATTVQEAHAKAFGELIIQDGQGRMKPLNTFTSELLRKISKEDHYRQLNSDQVFLSMLLNPQAWYSVDFFYVKKGNDSLHQILGVEKNTKRVAAIDFFDDKFAYKLAPYLEEAYATELPNQFQTDFKDADMRLNLLNSALAGDILKIFPLENDPNNKWVSSLEYKQNMSVIKDTLYGNFVGNSLRYYLLALQNSIKTNDYTDADKILSALKRSQQKVGQSVYPSSKRIQAEIVYNKVNIFERLFQYYLYAGLLLFVLLIAQVFSYKKWIAVLANVLKYIVFVLFLLHTLGLAARWYISGHAPWSNAYESMIYVSWATMGIGTCFAKRSPISFASTAFVTAMMLMVAHWNWLDPSIGTLQPVLNSYWLMLHVAVIVGSYGPFFLGMILGGIVLVLFIIKNKTNQKKITNIIKELTIVNELALTVGLIMLTIGNFLGAQWANESWGRYWGWDPKETWALVSIMVYAFVIHLRLVPGLRGVWVFNFFSVVAIASILMTYFGVNFYLSGLHSYASGEKVVTPNFVYYSVIIVAVLGIVSFTRMKLFNAHKK